MNTCKECYFFIIGGVTKLNKKAADKEYPVATIELTKANLAGFLKSKNIIPTNTANNTLVKFLANLLVLVNKIPAVNIVYNAAMYA